MRTLSHDEFVNKANMVHNNKYQYKEKYVNSYTKLEIFCPEHGPYSQVPSVHLQGQKCPTCANVKRPTTEEMVTRFKKTHGDKYDYGLMNYINKRTKIKIKCNSCNNIFEKFPCAHLKEKGCTYCSEGTRPGSRYTTELFIEKAIEKHGKDKFDYGKVKYITSRDKVKIICKACNNEFEQEPAAHLQGEGCRKCWDRKLGNSRRLTLGEIVKRCNEVHTEGDYDYSNTIFIRTQDSMNIWCNKCESEFIQPVNSHLRGGECPCSNRSISKGEKLIMQILRKLGINFKIQVRLSPVKNRKYDFEIEYNGNWYILEYDGQQHFIEKFFRHICLDEQHDIDIEKTNAAIEEGYRVIRIDYTIKYAKLEEEIMGALNFPYKYDLYCSTPSLYSWLKDECTP